MFSRQNVGRADQVIRILVGLTLLGFALFCPWAAGFGAIVTWPAGLIGAILVVTGISRRCPAYDVIGTSTKK
jgi:fatty acid desaturase